MSEQFEIEASPADRRRQKIRGAILEAAERVFAEEGESGLSIRRLADAIDYSPSAIYKYFGSKDELIDELKEAFFGRLMACMDRAAFQSLPFEQRIRRCFMTYVEVATERPHHYLAAFSSSGDGSAAEPRLQGADFWSSEKGKAFGIVVAVVREGQEAGLFDRSLEPLQAARSLWASMHGLAQLLISAPHFSETVAGKNEPVSNSEFTAFHVDLMIRGLRPLGPPPGKNEPAHD